MHQFLMLNAGGL